MLSDAKKLPCGLALRLIYRLFLLSFFLFQFLYPIIEFAVDGQNVLFNVLCLLISLAGSSPWPEETVLNCWLKSLTWRNRGLILRRCINLAGHVHVEKSTTLTLKGILALNVRLNVALVLVALYLTNSYLAFLENCWLSISYLQHHWIYLWKELRIKNGWDGIDTVLIGWASPTLVGSRCMSVMSVACPKSPIKHGKPHIKCGDCTSVACPKISLAKHIETTQHCISKNFLCKNM